MLVAGALCILAGCLRAPSGARGWPLRTGHLAPAVPGEAYPFPRAASIVAARDGGVWISEDNGRVALAAPNGRMTEFVLAAGTSAAAMTVANDGSLWYADEAVLGRAAASGAVRAYRLPNGTHPRALAVASDGSVWFATYADVGRLNPSTGLVRMLGRWPARFAPGGIAAGPSDTLWVTDAGNNAVVKLHAGTRTTYPIPVDGCNPADIVFGADRNMWFAESNVDGLGRMTPAGVFRQFPLDSPAATAGSDPKARIAPGHIAPGPDGIWISESFSNSVLRMAYDGKQIHFRTPGNLSQPQSIAKSADGSVWFAQYADPRVVARLDAKRAFAEFALPVPASSIDVIAPAGIVPIADGSLWLFDDHRVGRLKSDGTFATVATFPKARISSAGAASEGDLVVAEFERRAPARIARIALDGAVREFSPAARDREPSELAVARDDTVWSFAHGSRTIRKLTRNGAFSVYALRLPAHAEIAQIFARSDRGASIVIEDPSVFPQLELENIDSHGRATLAARFDAVWNEPPLLVARDGTIWYEDELPDAAHYGNFIDTLTRRAPDGRLLRRTMPWPDIPLGIGVDGSVWFPTSGAEAVGHLRSDGRFEEFVLPSRVPPLRFASAANGDMWFVYAADLRQRNGPTLGEISHDGKVAEYRVVTTTADSAR